MIRKELFIDILNGEIQAEIHVVIAKKNEFVRRGGDAAKGKKIKREIFRQQLIGVTRIDQFDTGVIDGFFQRIGFLNLNCTGIRFVARTSPSVFDPLPRSLISPGKSAPSSTEKMTEKTGSFSSEINV